MALDLRGTARPGLPVSVRNNNPGAIIYDPRNQWVGQTGFEETGGRKFATFDTPENGRRAQLKLLANHIRNGADTPLKLFSKWAPASDGNDPVAYASSVAASIGIDPQAKLNPDDLGTLQKIAAASGRVEAGSARAPGQYNNHEPLPDVNPFSTFDPETYYDQGIGVGAMDARRPLGPAHYAPTSPQKTREQVLGAPQSVHADNTPAGLPEAQAVEQAEKAVQDKKDSYNAWDRFSAGFQNNSLAAALYRAVDKEHQEASPEWARYYADNSAELDKNAQNSVELDTLRESTSKEDYQAKLSEIEATRDRQFIQYSGGTGYGLMYGLAGGVADPAGWVAGFGVGKAAQVVGLGSRALYLSGRMGAAAASIIGEGALGNVAVTAGLDLAGEHMTTSDYASAAAFGMGIGALAAPFHLRGIRNHEVARTAEAIREGAAEALGKLRERAAANLGEDAPESAVSQEMRRIDAEDMQTRAREALTPAPDEHRLAPSNEAQVANMDMEFDEHVLEGPEAGSEPKPRILPEGFITSDAALRDRIVDQYGLDAIPDEGTRAMAAEHYARAEKLVGDNPINKAALKTILKAGNLESTSNTLLSSDNPLAQAWGISMLENGQGAAGRRATAAIEQNTRERVYLRQLANYDNAFSMFRKGEGVGVMKEVWTGDARKQFNRRIFAEIEARSEGTHGSETNGAVLDAVNMLEKGYGLMGAEARTAGIVGHARISEDSVGYQPHRISAGKVAKLMENKEQRRAIAQLISDQLQSDANAYEVRDESGAVIKRTWDKKFADQFAAKYLDDAARRAQGGWDIPVNIHDPMAADVVMDAAKALNLPPEMAQNLLGKFSRGGAGFTKKRLRLNLLEDVPDGNGGTMKLMDLFNQDALSLYRGYARRMSGEVSLANRGILGKKGVEVYRDAMRAGGADNETLRAFDQTAAEFLNTPFGEANHKYLDNIRVTTSLLRLGGMGFTQFGEYGNALATLGVSRTLQSIGSFKRLYNEVGQLAHGGDTTNAILRDLDTWSGGVGLTEYHFTRLFDVPDNDIQPYNGESIGIGTRVVRAGGNLQAVLSGHRAITAVQVRGMAEQMARKAMEYVREGKSDTALLDAGISPELQARLKANIGQIAEFDGAGRLKSLSVHAGDLTPVEVQDFQQAIFRSANQIIQHTFTGETGRWAHNGFLKMLTQFRTFGVISIEKQWGRNVENHGAIKSTAYLIGAMSFAAPITIARLHMRTLGMTRSDREKYLKQNLTIAQLARATMNYASASGIAGDVFDVANGFAGGWAGPDYADGVGLRGQGQGSISNMIPALGALEDGWKAAHGNPHKIAGMMPFGSLPYVQPAISGIANSLDH